MRPRDITNAITAVGKDGTRLWNAGLSRTHMSSSSDGAGVLFSPEEIIHAFACVGHGGYVSERNPLAYQANIVDANTSDKPTPTVYAVLCLLRISRNNQSML